MVKLAKLSSVVLASQMDTAWCPGYSTADSALFLQPEKAAEDASGPWAPAPDGRPRRSSGPATVPIWGTEQVDENLCVGLSFPLSLQF